VPIDVVENDPESRQVQEFYQHFRSRLSTELRKVIVNKFPKEAKFAGLHSQVKALMESLVDTGLVDEALNNVAHSFKRRCDAVNDNDSQNNTLSIMTEPNLASRELVHEEEEEDQLGVRLGPSPSISAVEGATPEFVIDLEANLPDQRQAESWDTQLSMSLDTSTAGPYEFISPSEVNNMTETRLREQSGQIWSNFGDES
jgi:hypothetical protein